MSDLTRASTPLVIREPVFVRRLESCRPYAAALANLVEEQIRLPLPSHPRLGHTPADGPRADAPDPGSEVSRCPCTVSCDVGELAPVTMGIELLGGLALFLYGMEKMTDGLKAAAGDRMNALLGKLTGNRVLGAFTGAVVTAVIQSSSVTTVLVVGFVSAGLMTLVQSVGVIFGANVGTTVTAQIVAFNTTALAFPLIAAGFVTMSLSKRGVARHYGAMLLGLGLLFYGMAAMGSAMAPLRTHQGFADLLQSLQNPILGMLAGALFTALVQSSSATIGLAVVMATQGLLSLPAGIAILFGAKIGTGITALLAGIGKPQDAKRAAVVHVLFNLLGALLWLPFIAQLAAIAEAVSPAAVHLDGVERLAEEVPRQIANAATIWAFANTVIFLPFASWFAALAIRLIPDRVSEGKAIVEPRYLDEAVIRVPSMALERVRMELRRMGQMTSDMLADARKAFESREVGALAQRFDQVVVLRDAVLVYLQRLGRSELSDEEADEQARLLVAAGEIESMSAVIGRDLPPLVRAYAAAGVAPTDEAAVRIDRLLEATQAAAQAALRALVDENQREAQAVVARRDEILALTTELRRLQAAQVVRDEPDRLAEYRVRFEILDGARRIYGLAEHMALSVLPRGVVAADASV